MPFASSSTRYLSNQMRDLNGLLRACKWDKKLSVAVVIAIASGDHTQSQGMSPKPLKDARFSRANLLLKRSQRRATHAKRYVLTLLQSL